MKVIKETKKIGKTVYNREVGVELTLLDMIEHAELNGTIWYCPDGSEFYTDDPTEYTVTVNGKEVDAKDVHITLESPQELLVDLTFYANAIGDERTEKELIDLESLKTLNKDELIQEVLDLRRVID